MPTVNTVLGPVETAHLGFTLMHEHVGTNAAGLRHTYPEILDREGLLEQSVAAMREAYQAGVRTMVEVTTFDLGRDIGLIQEVSRQSGVHLIAATGNHLAVPRPFGEIAPDVLARLYSREIEEGIEGTGIKAGITIVHINTELRLAWRGGLEQGLKAHPDEIAPYKILPAAVDAIERVVLARLKLFNS